jgi:hypothetical protein
LPILRYLVAHTNLPPDDVLTSREPPYDPAMGTHQLRALLCRIAKAEAA